MHNDVEGTPLSVGDRVVYTEHETSHLFFGIVEGFTPKKVKVFREGAPDHAIFHSNKDPNRLLKVSHA